MEVRSEIQISPDQHDVAVNVAVTSVELRTGPLLNFRPERVKRRQEIFRHLVACAKVLERSIVRETKTRSAPLNITK